MQQNIGFYPFTGYKSILTATPVEGKFVDNANHEFNASLSMNLTPDKFKSTLDYMQNLAGLVKYDIDDYNCTDFALQVFNKERGTNPLTIPKIKIPWCSTPKGSSTPQGLYMKLKAMQTAGDSEASNISIPGYKGFVTDSSGPCN